MSFKLFPGMHLSIIIRCQNMALKTFVKMLAKKKNSQMICIDKLWVSLTQNKNIQYIKFFFFFILQHTFETTFHLFSAFIFPWIVACHFCDFYIYYSTYYQFMQSCKVSSEDSKSISSLHPIWYNSLISFFNKRRWWKAEGGPECVLMGFSPHRQ